MISPLIIQGSIKLIGFSLGLLCRRMCNRQSVEIKICERPKKGTHVGLSWNIRICSQRVSIYPIKSCQKGLIKHKHSIIQLVIDQFNNQIMPSSTYDESKIMARIIGIQINQL